MVNMVRGRMLHHTLCWNTKLLLELLLIVACFLFFDCIKVRNKIAQFLLSKYLIKPVFLKRPQNPINTKKKNTNAKKNALMASCLWHHIKPYWLLKKEKLATLVEGDQKAPFSIATTPWCRGGHYSFAGIAPLYPWYLIVLSIKQGGIKYHF